MIAAYTMDRWDELSRAVASVRHQTKPPREIIVVIDGNEELRRRAEAELTAAIVTANRHGSGNATARQTGAELATGSIVAFLDDDALADRRWLAELSRVYADDPRILGVGGLIEPLWRSGRPRWFPKEFDWVVGCTYAGIAEHGGPVRNVIGANMSIRARVLRTTGTWEVALGRVTRGSVMYGTAEETEFCIRAQRLHPGCYWMYCPEARVQHVVPASRASWRYFVHRCRVEGKCKAVLAELAGRDSALSSERRYVRLVLPRAVGRELADAVTGRPEALLRAGVIVAGVLITAWEYALERGRTIVSRRRSRPNRESSAS